MRVPAAGGQRREALGGELERGAADLGVAEPGVPAEEGGRGLRALGPGAGEAADGEGRGGGRGGEEEAGPPFDDEGEVEGGGGEAGRLKKKMR